MAIRGVTAKRYAEGSNVVVIPPDILDVFPDAATVAEALRALAPVIRHQRQLHTKTLYKQLAKKDREINLVR